MELLAPNLLRKRGKKSDEIGGGGERLSSFIGKIGTAEQARLTQTLSQFYPCLKEVKIKSRRFGWKELIYQESIPCGGEKHSFTARYINDGLLRLTAILSLMQMDLNYEFLLFDEIENGINPEIAQKLVSMLLAARQQVVVTTHSPLVLNYLPDEVAKESVVFVYRNRQGHTRATPFFQIPEPKQKLQLLGPGEVYLDTFLTAIADYLTRHNGDET